MKFTGLRTILFFIKDYKRYIFAILLCSILYAVFEGLNIAILFPIINSIIKADAGMGAASGIVKFLTALIEIIPIQDLFIAGCIFIIIVILAKNFFRYLYMVLGAYGSYKVWQDTQKKLFTKYINADYRYFLGHKHGEIVYRLYNAPSEIGAGLQIISQLLTEVLKVGIITSLLLAMSPPVTCGVFIIGGIFYFFTRGISKRTSYFRGKGRVDATEQQNVLINEMINGIKQIKIFLAEKKWTDEFFTAIDNYFNLAKKDTRWLNMPVSTLEVFALTTLSIFLIFIRKFSPQNLVSNLPLLGVFAYAFQRIMPSISLLITIRMQIMGSLPVLEMLHSAINEKTSSLKDGTKVITSFNEKIEFEKVSFSYGNELEVLKNISICLRKNECVAIVGKSGSGKTTIVNLVIRLFDPTQGRILVDGIDLREYKKDSWLSKIGFVSQDAFIFHASVRDNIAFGFEGANMDDIIQAAKIANAHDFILKMPQGYDTIVGEKGMKLSGGEQQRIAIARAIVRKPQILIFDEATSALDNVSQALIQSAINKIVKDYTVILIAHRLSTIVNADKLIVLDKGEIKETGSHERLIAKKGHYWNLYNI